MNASPSQRELPSRGQPPAPEDWRSASAGRLAINAWWLLKLRWVAVVGQFATIAVAAGPLGLSLPLGPLLTIVGATAASNVAFAFWLRRQFRRRDHGGFLRSGQAAIVALMALDLAALTGLLYFSGGPANPFSVFFFVNLALAAVILPPAWAFALTGLAVACYAGLFWRSVPLPELRSGDDPAPWKLTDVGLLVAVALCAAVVVYFVTCVTRELRRRESQLRLLEQQRSRDERLEALATLAAGAAHELATPLSTIAVAASELTRHVQTPEVSVLREDAALIRGEVQKCRAILDRLSGHSGQALGAEVESIPTRELIDDVLAPMDGGGRIRVELTDAATQRSVTAPRQTLAQAIRGVLQNALDATPPSRRVRLTVTQTSGGVRLEIIDAGHGMSPETLARAGEPFFTTKPPGEGMGLGLFLAGAVLRGLGGALELDSAPGRGTTATIHLPTGPNGSERAEFS